MIAPWTPIKPTPAPIEPATPAEFRIVSAAWAHPVSHQSCEVAQLADGRRLARQTVPGQHDKPVYIYSLIDPDPAKNPVALNNFDDQLYRLHNALDLARAHPKNPPGLLQKTPLEVEAQKFCQQWPHLGWHFKLNEIKVARLFDVGDKVWRSSLYDREKAGDVDWKAYLDMHGAGDFGVEGKLADVGELTEEQAWTIGLQPQLIRNAEAIRSGLGLVKSEWRPTGPTGREFVVRVETALMRDVRRIFTYVTVVTPPS